MEWTREKSTNEKLKFAYELTISMLPEPLKTLAQKGGESAFRNKTAIEKTAEIIEKAVEELLKKEIYEVFTDFFKGEKFSLSQINIVKGSESLANQLYECYTKNNSISDEGYLKLIHFHITEFAKELLAKVNEKIDADSELHTFWKLKSIGEQVTDIHDATVKAIDHNADYRNKWNERCCLHRNPTQPLVTLETIYVMPEVQVGEERLKVGDCVKDFLENDTQHILLLLGHGGYGKTSFVARMAAKTGEYTDRPLHIFRLREFADVEANNLHKEILDFTQNKLEDDAVLVFDGLDELCMVGGGNENQKSLVLMEQLAKFWRDYPTRKIIVTSRPEYIHAPSVEINLHKNTPVGLDQPILYSYEYAVFDDHQRTELADKLERADSSLKNSVGCQHVRAYSGEKDDPIYGSPFLLYLICAGRGITEECFSNRWLLFRTVFHDININPAYRGTTPTQQEEFARKAENAKKLYRITSRLAYEIYKTGYKKPYFQKEEVLNIIRALYPDETSKLISALGDCYALCAYFKQTENGAVEFAHNHVRDFFLCEYILQGLDDLYAKRPEMTAVKCGKKVADWLSDNFKYAKTEDETNVFLALAAEQKKIACPNVEQYFKPDELKHVFNVFCHNGGLREYRAVEMPIGVQTAAGYVIWNSAYFLKILLPKTNGLIQWFDVKQLNDGERVIIEEMGLVLEHADLSPANLRGADLSSAYLSGANLSDASLIDANLGGADLRNANLRYAILSGANLRGADLSDADLSSAYLIGANLRGAWYNDDTDFTNVTPHDFDPEKAGMKKR